VYLVFAGTFHIMFLKGRLGAGFDEGAGATWLNAGIAILLTWLTVAVGIIRLEVSKWLPNVGAVVKVAIFLGLGALGLQFLLSGGTPANEFSLRALLPSWSDGLAFLPILLYNTLGFELMSSAGEEMKEPQKDVPRVVLLSGAIICVVYMLGALGILLVVPLEKLSLLTGTWDALALLGQQWGTAGEALTLALGLGFLYACVANVVTWSLGVNRVAAAAAEDGMAPAILGRLHPRYKTPYVAFVIMGAVSTALLVGNALLSSNPSNVFWMIFKLSSLCLLLCYLAMFPAFLRLRQTHPDRPRPYRLPGGMPAAWAVTVVCWLFVFLTCLLFFKPAPGSEDATKEALLLAGETLLTIVVGYLLIPRQPARA
jgi:amino acid transporter